MQCVPRRRSNRGISGHNGPTLAVRPGRVGRCHAVAPFVAFRDEIPQKRQRHLSRRPPVLSDAEWFAECLVGGRDRLEKRRR